MTVDGSSTPLNLVRSAERWQAADIEIVTARRGENEIGVTISAPKSRPSRVRLRWHAAFPDGSRFLGDQWERSYGDLEWRGIAGERLMPWYFLAARGGVTDGYGVKTGASAICCWQTDDGGITLWLDVSNGGGGVELGATPDWKPRPSWCAPARRANRRWRRRARSAARCATSRGWPRQPIYGSNNWYYAYGKNTSAAGILKDAELMAELMPANPANRPYVVIDMGWGAAPRWRRAGIADSLPAIPTWRTWPAR